VELRREVVSLHADVEHSIVIDRPVVEAGQIGVPNPARCGARICLQRFC